MKYLIVSFLLIALIPTIFSKDNVKEKKFLNIGYSTSIFTEININDVKAVSNILSDQIGTDIEGRSKLKSNTIIFENTNQLINLINNNELDIIGLTGLEYLEVSKKCNLEPIGVHSTDNQAYEELIIVVNNEKQISNIKDLKGKSLVIANKDHNLTNK